MKKIITFKKFDNEQQLVFGIVYAPLTADSQGDWATAESIEKMCHGFNAKGLSKAIDTNHDLKENGSVVVENFIARKGDPNFPEGAWAMGIKTPDHVWELVKSGELNGLSMYGNGERTAKGLPGQPTAKHELFNADIQAISIVKRAANQEKFSVIKSDQDPMAFLVKQIEAIAKNMQNTNETIRAIQTQQKTLDASIASLSAGSDGRVRKAEPVRNQTDEKIDYQLRKQARLQERLECIFERPDLFHDGAEDEVCRRLEKSADKLHGLGYNAPRAGIDTNSSFYARGGSSDFLVASPMSIEDVLGVGHATRRLSKSDEDAINVENCMIL